jgi:hypothetical protein
MMTKKNSNKPIISTNVKPSGNIGDNGFERKDSLSNLLEHLGLKTGGLAIFSGRKPCDGEKWLR